MGETTRLPSTIVTLDDIFGAQRPFTKRQMRFLGLKSHIYDVTEPGRLISSKRNVGHTNHVGVHSNA